MSTNLNFSSKNHELQKKKRKKKENFVQKKMKKILNYMLYIMNLHAIWVDEMTEVIISIKKNINKNQNIFYK